MATGAETGRWPRATDTSSWPDGLPEPVSMTVLPGGWVGETASAILADGREVIVKRSPFAASDEADGLTALADARVPVPSVLGVGGDTLVLERVGDSSPPTAEDWAALGRSIAGMHQVHHPAYGWHRDNHAGRFEQPNPWSGSWPTFFAEHRVRIHLEDPSVPVAIRRRLERACDVGIPSRLPERPPAVLTHGDLWMGNVIAGRFVIDPEVSATDRELDLAYMQMSSKSPFPDPFWGGYREVLELPNGYQERRPVLELHHRLLQVRHFGAGQIPRLLERLDELGW